MEMETESCDSMQLEIQTTLREFAQREKREKGSQHCRVSQGYSRRQFLSTNFWVVGPAILLHHSAAYGSVTADSIILSDTGKIGNKNRL